ncbi:MAG: TRAP transporter small permease subunit [Gammaproteobacteria bacterium]|jgi:TRAP-type mannitol/chloroaromatic compound transport system permease small subunit
MSVTHKNASHLLKQDRQSTRERAGSVTTGLARVANVLDRCIGISGRLSSWLCLLLALMVAGDVLARYIWHVGSVAEQELEWHVLAVIAMMGASYTLQQGEHVRVDVFYQYYSERFKQWLDVLIPLLIVVPTAVFIAYVSLRFVQMSYNLHEGSPDPGGLPARYLLKAFIPLGFGLVGIQGVAMFLDGLVKLLQSRQT